MANEELFKLVAIVGGGIVIIVVGYFFQSWKKKKKAEKGLGLDSENFSEEEFKENLQIKNYILQYKSSYSKEQIREALLQAHFDQSSVDEHINRYF